MENLNLSGFAGLSSSDRLGVDQKLDRIAFGRGSALSAEQVLAALGDPMTCVEVKAVYNIQLPKE